jgi:uncharacterized protein YndB with AHSA1/START domain
MDIKADAPAVVRVEAEVLAPPETVFAVIAEVASWPRWNPDVRSASMEGPVSKGTRFRWKAGPSTITSTLEDVEPPRRISWTGTTMGIRAVHVYELTPRGDRTLVVTKESWDGLLVRLFRTSMRGVLQKSLEAGLGHLKVEAERRAQKKSAADAIAESG